MSVLGRFARPSPGLRAGLRVLVRSPSARAGLAFVSVVLLAAALAPWLAPRDPIEQDLPNKLRPPGAGSLLGTDRYGRDMLSRVLWGARLSLVLGSSAILIGATGGIGVGIVSGYRGGWMDALIQRVVDVMLTFRLLLLSILIVAILGPSLRNTALAIGISVMGSFARMARGEAVALRTRDFVQAALASGASDARILLWHVLPNMLGPLIVMATLLMGSAILAESALSFLGLGPPPPQPSWGLMVKDGLSFVTYAPWVSMAPGAAITLLVLGLNLLGDGLRDALDPRLRGSRGGR